MDEDNSTTTSRRGALAWIGGAFALGAGPIAGAKELFAVDEALGKTTLGLVSYCVGIRRKATLQTRPDFDLFDPLRLLEHCRSIGAGGIQAALGTPEAERARAVREFAERHGLFVEAIVSPPQDAGDVARFEREIAAASECGASIARTVVIPGRRYEQFKSLDEFRAAEKHAEETLRLALPTLEKHRFHLAIENHKDQRLDERIALFRRLDSEFVGACVDTGNSVALLEDPYEVVEALAPYALSVHLKDQALASCDDGFLLGDVPLGEGALDLKRMVDSLRRARPWARFFLELITRDPLRVPCLAESYWAPMPEIPARDLARTLRLVRERGKGAPPTVSELPLRGQVEREDANVIASLRYAKERLGF